MTFEGLIDRLGERSFGLVVLLLAIVALAPGASTLAGLLLAFLALQMALAHPQPSFPRHLARRRLDGRHLAWAARRAVPALRCLEGVARPRWPTPHGATQRLVGVAVLLLGALLLAPVPLSNIPRRSSWS
ncbi:exopolysaccharide biosynthesis protein [Siccirubricoccus deserti]